MISTRISIDNGPAFDTYQKWGFIFMSSDNRTEAPIKPRDATAYAEVAGENVDPRTVQAAFDYKVKFLIECPNRDKMNANAKIATFNRALYLQSADNHIRHYKEITFYDDYKRVKVVGIPEPIAEPTEFYRRQDARVNDCVEVELIIHVNDPTKCNFSMTTGSTAEESMEISLTTDGENLYVQTSRPLAANEYPYLLRRGSVRNKRTNWVEGSYNRKRGRHRWQVYYQTSVNDSGDTNIFTIDGNGAFVVREEFNAYPEFERLYRWHIDGYRRPYARIRKSRSSKFLIPALAGRTAKITYGIGIYKYRADKGAPIRISNIAYFRSNMKMLRDVAPYEEADDSAIEQWLSV